MVRILAHKYGHDNREALTISYVTSLFLEQSHFSQTSLGKLACKKEMGLEVDLQLEDKFQSGY